MCLISLCNRYQLWPLDKKLRVIRTAKEYVRRHESELQEKYAQSRTLGSYLQQAQLLLLRFLQVRLHGKALS